MLGEIYMTPRFYKDDLTLIAYQEKSNKNVLLFSYVHTNVNTAKNDKRQPDTVAFYS